MSYFNQINAPPLKRSNQHKKIPAAPEVDGYASVLLKQTKEKHRTGYAHYCNKSRLNTNVKSATVSIIPITIK